MGQSTSDEHAIRNTPPSPYIRYIHCVLLVIRAFVVLLLLLLLRLRLLLLPLPLLLIVLFRFLALFLVFLLLLLFILLLHSVVASPQTG